MKTKFKDSKIGTWLADKAPNILDIVGDAFPPVKILSGLLGIEDLSPADKAEAMRLVQDYELEMARIEVSDRASARQREVDMAKTNRHDWLMYAAGVTALGTFILMVFAVIFISAMKENPLFHQLMGIIEGVALTVFAYYFGTSKSSAEKTHLLGKKE